MSEFELVADLYRQIAFSAAILGGFAMTFLSTLLTSEQKRTRLFPFITGALVIAATLLIVATLGATMLLTSVQQLSLTFHFDSWPSDLIRSKLITEVAFFSGVLALLSGIGLSGYIKQRAIGHITAGCACLGLALLITLFLPTF